MFEGKTGLKARAILVGERLDLRALENSEALGEGPLVIAAGVEGAAVLFRFGAVVLLGVSPLEEATFLAQLQVLVRESFESPETEAASLELSPEGDKLEKGVVKLRVFDVPRLQIIADILAKSVVLAHYESTTEAIFESIEPFAQSLRAQNQRGAGQRAGKVKRGDRELLSTIGDMLLIEHRTVGIAQVGDKPETLWERPELERLYARLEDEYEVAERQAALARKLEVISRTAETVLNLLQHQSGLRVEWYIVALIVFEIGLSLFDMFGRR